MVDWDLNCLHECKLLLSGGEGIYAPKVLALRGNLLRQLMPNTPFRWMQGNEQDFVCN